MARLAAGEARVHLGPNYARPCRLTQDGPAGPVERSARKKPEAQHIDRAPDFVPRLAQRQTSFAGNSAGEFFAP